MQFGLGIPTCREGRTYPCDFADMPQIAAFAREAEQLGFDALWANDHLATQRAVLAEQSKPANFYEPLITFAYLAAQTARIRFVVATMVAPLRQPVLLAKQAITLDRASQGRFVLGLGIGANREEFEIAGNPPPKANRGRMMDEMVDALRLLFEQDRAAFAGEFYRFEEIAMHPKPVQNPMPIYLGASAPEGIRRVARVADGWIVSSTSPEKTGEGIGILREEIATAGRDASAVQSCVQLWVSIGETESAARAVLDNSLHFQQMCARRPELSADEHARAFAAHDLLGTPAQIGDRIAAYADAGADHLGLILLARDADELSRSARLLGEEVLPRFRA
jgi:probable F420-dependent oxidoreductase